MFEDISNDEKDLEITEQETAEEVVEQIDAASDENEVEMSEQEDDELEVSGDEIDMSEEDDELEVSCDEDEIEMSEQENNELEELELSDNEHAEEGFLNEEDMSELSDDETLQLSDEEISDEEVSEELSLEGSEDLEDSEGDEQSEEQVVFELEEALNLKGQIEAAIFASPKPLKVTELIEIIGLEEDQPSSEIEALLEELEAEYRDRMGGFKLEYIKRQGYQFRTVQAAAPLMEKIFSHRPEPLSKAALETLAIIAYRQASYRADIGFVRGVNAGSIVKNLVERELIKCVGRKEVAGRPMLLVLQMNF